VPAGLIKLAIYAVDILYLQSFFALEADAFGCTLK
jgi:hypothetical protein